MPKKSNFIPVFTLLSAILVTTTPARAQKFTIPAENIAAVIDYMEQLEDGGFSGGVAISVGGKVLVAEGFGLADQASGTPYTAEIISTLGSVTKQFTGAAIMKLQMMGKVSVDDTIGKFFSGAPEEKSTITVHQLLTHTAGFRDALGFDFEEVGRGEYLRRAFDSELQFEPGSKYAYSNVGYSILAAILETVTGESYDEFVYERLFKPAGMNDTGYDLNRIDKTRLASGYRGDEDWGNFAEKAWDTDGPYWHLRGNGGLLSSLSDMLKWHIALSKPGILSEQALEDLQTPYVKEGPGGSSYAYGWSIEQSTHGNLVTHNGGNPYFSTDFRRYTDADIAMLVMANTAEHTAFGILPRLARIAFEGPSAIPEESQQVESLSDLSPFPAVAQDESSTLGSSARTGRIWGLPDSPGGRALGAFLDAVTQSDTAILAAYVRRHFAEGFLNDFGVDGHVDQLQQIFGAVGSNPMVEGARRQDTDRMVLTLRTTGGSMLKITMFIGRDSKIDGIGIE